MSDLFSGAQRARGFDEDEESMESDSVESVETVLDEQAEEATEASLTEEEPGDSDEGPAAEPAPVVDGLADSVKAELIRPGATETVYATWGARGFWRRVTGGLLKIRPGKAEQRHLDNQRVIRQATWSRSVNVLVANKAGGVGKTTSALVLAGVLGSVRGGSVTAFEVADAAGSLEKRAEGSPTRGMGELVPVAGEVTSSGELAGFAAPQTSLADVIGSVEDRAVLTADDVRDVRQLLDRYSRITVADSGNNPHSEAFAAAVETADVLVVPTLLYPTSVLDALDLLERVNRMSDDAAFLAERAVIVCNDDGKPVDAETRQRAREILDQVQERIPELAILDVPYDGHIGRHGEITLDSLSLQSRVKWTKVAAEVTDRLLAHVR